jgi:hypothetical protein
VTNSEKTLRPEEAGEMPENALIFLSFPAKKLFHYMGGCFFVQVCGIEKRIFVIICNNQKYIFGRLSSDEAKEKWEDPKT